MVAIGWAACHWTLRKRIMCAVMKTHPAPRSPEDQVPATKPPWLKRRALTVEAWQRMRAMLDRLALATICEEAACPNIGECFRNGTATFLILGRTCTRNCRFCAVGHGVPEPPDSDEPKHLIDAVRHLGLRHVVITSVTRDDLPDGGAAHFAACVDALHRATSVSVEVLVPDFQGNEAALQIVMDAQPEVLGHNVEVVPRLYAQIRPRADYERSLSLLRRAKGLCPTAFIKSGLMVGVGEAEEEVVQVMRDLRDARCDFLTIGQYLRPSPEHYPVVEYVAPAAFDRYADEAHALGFRGVYCGPFVRSSYGAADMLEKAKANSAAATLGNHNAKRGGP
jgi:lipoic acid synthetase